MVSLDIAGEGEVRLMGIAHVPQGRAAVVAQLVLHFACFFSNVSTLAVYWHFEEGRFFWTLFVVWLLCGVVVSWAALREFQPRASSQPCRCWIFHWVWVVLVFGICRGLQVRHICRFFKQRRATSAVNTNGSIDGESERLGSIVPTAFNSKTFDGIIEGLFFAIGNQFAFFMVDIAPPHCPWYMTYRFDDDCPACPLLRFIFLFSAACSMLTLAAAIVEVDYRVSTAIQCRINGSVRHGFMHFAYRASEVMLRLSAINLLCIFLRPQHSMQVVGGPYLLYMPVVVIWLISACLLHQSAKKHVAEQESPIAHVVVALASIAVNPTQFVDRQVYMAAAKSTAKAFFYMHLVEIVAICAFIGWSWNSPFPAACDLEGHPEPGRPSTIGPYTLWFASNHRLAYLELGVALLVHTGIIVFQPYTRKLLSLAGLCAEPEQGIQREESRVFCAASLADSLQAEVRTTVPRGLSSFLVQAGTGVTSKFFANREYNVKDFSVEKVLGKGGCGVVILVQDQWRGGEPVPQERRKYYALKLSNVRDPRQATYAQRDREYLLKLNPHKHPFVVRLEQFMDVSEEHRFEDENGELIQDVKRNCCFHKALMMEYCARGDLEGYLLRKALEAPGSLEPPPPGSEDVEVSRKWLETARTLCAQLVETVRFLHGLDFVHRDLKPGNVLLKTGQAGQHICVTDFGMAKQSLQGARLESFVGSHPYMAPEIRDRGITGPYTPAVDLWSLGKMILVMLWDTKYWQTWPWPHRPDEGTWVLQTEPEDAWIAGPDGQQRVPASALELVRKMMQVDAGQRGTAEDAAQHPFFQALDHQGVQLPALDFSDCQRRAAEGWY